MRRRTIPLLTGMLGFLFVVAVANAAAARPGGAAVAASPTFSTTLTVRGLGSGVTGQVSDTARSFRSQATATKVSFSATLPVNSPLLQPLTEASKAGTRPTAVEASIDKSGTSIETITLPSPAFSLQQEASRTSATTTVNFTATTATWAFQAGHGSVDAPAGRLQLRATSTGPTNAIPVVSARLKAGPAGSASPLQLMTSEPFDGAVSHPIVNALENHTTLFRIAVALYRPNSKSTAVGYVAPAVTVTSFQESVSAVSVTDTAGYAGTFRLKIPAPFRQRVSLPTDVLALPATSSTPALSIPLTEASATVVGGPRVVRTTEPLNTNFSPSLLMAAQTAMVFPHATLKLFSKPGDTSGVGSYDLTHVTVEQFTEDAGDGPLHDDVTFRFQSVERISKQAKQISPATPAGFVQLERKSKAITALISNANLDFATASGGGRTLGVKVRLPEDAPLSPSLVSAGLTGQRVQALDVAVFRPGTTTIATTYALNKVAVTSFVSAAGIGPLVDTVTLAPASFTVPSPPAWHPKPAQPAGVLAVTSANGARSTVPVSQAQVDMSHGATTATSREPFDSTMNPELISSIGQAQALSAGSLQFYDYKPRRVAIRWALRLPVVDAVDEAATGEALTDSVAWAVAGVNANFRPGPTPAFPKAGQLTVVLPRPSPSTVIMPVGEITDSIKGTTLAMSVAKTFDTRFLDAFVEASSGARITRVAEDLPGTTTRIVRFNIPQPNGTFTETATSSGISDALTLRSTRWTATWPVQASS